MFATRTKANLKEANEAVEQLEKKYDFTFLNLNNGLTDEKGNLKKEFAIEGLHMYPNGYSVVLKNMMPYLD